MPIFDTTYRTATGKRRTIAVNADSPKDALTACVMETGCDYSQIEATTQREGQTIRLEMSWREAAQIIAAALEHGTDKGRDAGRTELYRMAELLDDLRGQPDNAHAAVFEVRTVDPARPDTPLVLYFQTLADASGFWEIAEGFGYSAEVYSMEPSSLSAGLGKALDFFADRRFDPASDAAKELTA